MQVQEQRRVSLSMICDAVSSSPVMTVEMTRRVPFE